MIIYKTTNLVNGKYYVGKDEKNNPEYLGSGLLLNKAIKKYGIENFKKEILESCVTRKELNEREIHWIKELEAIEKGYNIALGGSGGDTYTNNPKLPKIIEKLSGENNHFYGKKHSNGSKDKIGESKLGKPSWNSGKVNVYSKKTKEKMSKAREAYTKENHPRFIEINKDVLVKILNETNSLRKTAEALNVSVGCIRGKIKLFNIKR
jgi:group I intron endonuclease